MLASFLRKNHRALKLSTLTCLNVLLLNYSAAIDAAAVSQILEECASLINESDLHISQLTITLLQTTCQVHPASMADIQKGILGQLLQLVRIISNPFPVLWNQCCLTLTLSRLITDPFPTPARQCAGVHVGAVPQPVYDWLTGPTVC